MPRSGDGSSRIESELDSFFRAIAAAPDHPVHVPEPLPERIGRFRIRGRLGSGGMGIVYRAEDADLRREVALKVLRGEHATDESRQQRFLREARAAAAIFHPNIAVVHEVGEAEGHIYIAMELVQGATLRRRLKFGRMPILEALGLTRQIARALAAAHAIGVVHRDLKPENVMITPSGDAKLLDFGLAKTGDTISSDSELGRAETEPELTRDGVILGTSSYMSPEQALGLPVDVRSDVFAFGIVLYEILAWVQPFRGSTSAEVRAAIATQPAPPLPEDVRDAAGHLASILSRCLAKSPEQRFENAGAIADALERIRGDALESHEKVDGDRIDPRDPPAPRRKTLWPLSFLVLTILAVGAFVVFSGRQPAATNVPPTVLSHNPSSEAPADLGETLEAVDLFWQVRPPEQQMTWRDAVNYCFTLATQGKGWRLPSKDELITLSASGRVPKEHWYWSSSGMDDQAWYVFFDNGGATLSNATLRTPSAYVRCVRDKPDAGGDDGIVVVSGRAWERDPFQVPLSWERAHARCNDLKLASGGWRLPTLAEASSLRRSGRLLDPYSYWCSDVTSDGAWIFSNLDDQGVAVDKAQPHYARCVR